MGFGVAAFGTTACHPYLRYDLLPMSPGWTFDFMVSAEGLEPSTP